ncbi:hydrogenase [Methanocella sp. CWC-04]|uniref:Hydrogenase n=1 Tax=Methanooceanicella nereidis TaxID=2052831 RepID=A0AAP2W4L2_9EURY|nr:4Fe-4S binding protein [Methanocella sp. CWC-04]MCD1294420.1 hydrogenase [Methanocella sp. CWC-04]
MLKILQNIVHNAISRPYTSNYPFTPYQHFPGTRADVSFDGSKCILCGLCQRSCPADCIVIHKEETKIEYLNTQCIRCGYCVRICPTNAIIQNEVYTKPSTDRLTVFTLVTNENAPIIKKRKAEAAAKKAAAEGNPAEAKPVKDAPGKTENKPGE